MIQEFACKETLKVWKGDYSKKFPSEIQLRANTKLKMLDMAGNLKDLMNFPANRLEKLKGRRQGEYSMRINDQWRICFQWIDDGAYRVKLEDYH